MSNQTNQRDAINQRNQIRQDQASETFFTDRYIGDGFTVSAWRDKDGTPIVQIDTSGFGAELRVYVNANEVYEGYPDFPEGD